MHWTDWQITRCLHYTGLMVGLVHGFPLSMAWGRWTEFGPIKRDRTLIWEWVSAIYFSSTDKCHVCNYLRAEKCSHHGIRAWLHSNAWCSAFGEADWRSVSNVYARGVRLCTRCLTIDCCRHAFSVLLSTRLEKDLILFELNLLNLSKISIDSTHHS